MQGLYGAIVIHGSSDSERPFHLISTSPDDQSAMRKAELNQFALLIADWTQFDFDQFYGIEQEANIDFTCMDAIIINGVVSPPIHNDWWCSFEMIK